MLTKEQALEATKRIWSELARTGNDDKSSVRLALSFDNYCPLCHYVREHFPEETEVGMFRRICLDLCPVDWPEVRSEAWMYTLLGNSWWGDDALPCQASHYRTWAKSFRYTTDTKDEEHVRKEAARAIVDLCKSKLKELVGR